MGTTLTKIISPSTRHRYSGYRVLHITQNGNYLGKGKLYILTDDLILQLLDGTKDRLAFPIRSIRRYGYHSNIFAFESGRLCIAGPSVYTMKVPPKYGVKIVEKLQRAMLRHDQDQLSPPSTIHPIVRDLSFPQVFNTNYAYASIGPPIPWNVGCDEDGDMEERPRRFWRRK